MFKQVFLLYFLIHAFPDCQCGLKTEIGRIFGGENAKPGQYPWPVRQPLPLEIGPSDMDNFNKECLDAHNSYRKKHGVQPLTIDKSLYESANRIAKDNKADGVLKHTNRTELDRLKAGENLFASIGIDDKPKCGSAVKLWYDEVKDYDFRTGRSINGKSTGHFTQLVWKATNRLGCGYSLKPGKSLVIACQYRPPGNFGGQYLNNVPPPLSK